MGLLAMQVCAWKDATDAEILAVCNSQNPAGTTNGWCSVVREVGEDEHITTDALPVQCADEPDRQHFVVRC
jgi:hypothetical protein